MAVPRSPILGAILILAGAALLLVGASAAGDDLPAAPPSGATLEAPSSASGETRLGVAADVLGAHVDRSVGAAPLDGLPLTGADREIGTPPLPLPVGLRAYLLRGPGPADAPASPTHLTASAYRAVSAPTRAAGAAAALAGAGAVLCFWRPLALGAITLYARVSNAEVFENAVRVRIFESIKARPGLSASDLAKVAGVSWGTTIYHLEVLEQNRMVSSLRNGRHRRYFENGASLAASKEVVALLQNPVTANVKRLVELSPGLTQKDLAGALGLTPQALHWHVRRLQGAGVVRKERQGRVVRHFSSAN